MSTELMVLIGWVIADALGLVLVYFADKKEGKPRDDFSGGWILYYDHQETAKRCFGLCLVGPFCLFFGLFGFVYAFMNSTSSKTATKKTPPTPQIAVAN